MYSEKLQDTRPTCENASCLVMSNSLPPHELYCPCNSPGKNSGVGSLPSPGDLPNPGIEPRSPIWQADSLPSEPPGKSRPIYRNLLHFCTLATNEPKII